MDYLLALLQGLGIAAAIGIRPFLPVLLAGALATADLGVDFEGTDFSFLERPGFLLVMVASVAVFGFVDRRRGTEARPRPRRAGPARGRLVLGALPPAGSMT